MWNVGGWNPTVSSGDHERKSTYRPSPLLAGAPLSPVSCAPASLKLTRSNVTGDWPWNAAGQAKVAASEIVNRTRREDESIKISSIT
jgi:hypothetical protein